MKTLTEIIFENHAELARSIEPSIYDFNLMTNFASEVVKKVLEQVNEPKEEFDSLKGSYNQRYWNSHHDAVQLNINTILGK